MKAESFWSFVDQSGGPDKCWPWRRGHCHGYGWVWLEGKNVLAHRIAYDLTHKRKAGRWKVRHTCDFPPCCNPKHLLRGTHRQNLHDAVIRGRLSPARGERNGKAKLTELKVKFARRQASKGVSGTRLAKRFSIDQSTMSQILLGRYWKHVGA